MRRSCVLTLTALVCLFCAGSSAQAAFPGQNGRIAFVLSDGDNEIWTMNANGSGQVKLTDNASSDVNPTWSPDGRWIAFASDRDGNYEIYVMGGSGSSPTRITNNPTADTYPAWSPGGEQIAFSSNRDGNYEIYKMNADGSGQARLTTDPATDSEPAWSPDGSKIAFTTPRFNPPGETSVWTMNPDGSGQVERLAGWSTEPDWRPDSSGFVYVARGVECDSGECPNEDPFIWNFEIVVENVYSLCCTGYESFSDPNFLFKPAMSPDGEMVVFQDQDGRDQNGILTWPVGPSDATFIAAGGFAPDWQPVNPGYARPKGGTPAAVQLVPALESCTSSNASHGPPLEAASCSPPVQESDYLTVGGTDGQPTAAKFHGVVDFKVIQGNPTTFADEADLRVVVSIDDVRRRSDYLDYEGELQASLPLRITDRWNGPSLNQAGTVADVPLNFSVPCTATDSTTVGSTCSVTTTADSVAPGVAREGRRSIWQVGQVEVYDGGADGDADTPGNTLFAVQGMFVP